LSNPEINILLVEDNPGDARLLREMLKDSTQIEYIVTVAADMSSTILNLNNSKFDIIILDLNLPDSNGLATLDKVINAVRGSVSVIVMTGLNDAETGVSAIERGAEDYLVKGELNSSQMQRSIRYAIERKRSELIIRESEERYKTFINATDDMAFLKDQQLRYIMVNDRNALYLDKSIEEIIGKTDFDLMDIDNARICRDSDTRILNENKLIISEEIIDGKIFETRKFPVGFSNGKFGVGGFIRDVTEIRSVSKNIEKAAQEWRITFDSISDIIWVIDPKNKILRANAASEKLFGISPADIIGKDYRDMFRNTGIPFAESPVNRVKKSYKPEKATININELWLNITVYPILNESGILTGIVHLIHDITSEKKAEGELLLRTTAMEYAANAIMISDKNGIILWTNPAFEKLTLYSPSEVTGLNPRDILKSGKQGEEFYKKLWETITSGRIWTGELINRKKDGSLYAEEMTIAPVKHSNGEIQNYIAIKQDITDRKLASELLNTRLELLNYSSGHTLDELLVKTLDEIERFTSSKISFFHLIDDEQNKLSLHAWSTGTTRDFLKSEVKGLHYIIDDDSIRADCIRKKKTVVRNNCQMIPNCKQTPSGQPEISREMLIPVIRENKIRAIIGVCNKINDYNEKDISVASYLADIAWDTVERKKYEESLKQFNLELERRVAERTYELEKANRELDSFSYSVSHDLRAPLRHISGFIEMMKLETGSTAGEKLNHYMDVILDSSKKMGQLIDDLLSFSRMGRTSISNQHVKMNMLVNDVLKDFSDEIQAGKILLKTSPLPDVKGDRALLRVVYVNLISNAIKFSGKTAKAEISIGSRIVDNENIFYVQDNGAGFDMSYADKLFGVFQRLHSDREFSGTGIGLAIVKNIIERHNGRVWADSKPGKGACFYFVIPHVITDSKPYESGECE